MFAQNIDLLHSLTVKEIDGLSVGVPTIQMELNPGKESAHFIPKFSFELFRTYITGFMYVRKMFFK
jgi:hypothetical protein